MKTTFAFSLFVLSLAAQAGPLELLPAAAGDLQPAALAAPSAPIAAPAEAQRAPIAFSWAAGGDVKPPAAVPVQSRESYAEASADELARGITIYTTAPRALVRIQPLGDADPGARAALAIAPESLTLVNAAGKPFTQGAGMQLLATADKVAKAGLPFAPGTSAFRVHPDVGAGALTLKAEGLTGSQRYLVNVVEPDSPNVLTLQTDAPQYLHGGTLTVLPALADTSAGTRSAPGKIEGTVVSPGGRSFPLTFKPGKDGMLRAALPLDADEAPAPGLWEARVHASSVVRGLRVERDARVAFAAAMPAARLTRSVHADAAEDGLRLRFGIEAAAPGRYEVRGLVYGMVDGVQQLIAVADGAQWLDVGQGEVAVVLPRALLARAQAPFELRELTLHDQTRVAVMQRQQRALALEAKDIGSDGSPASARLAAPPRAKNPPSLAGK
ncbi:MAG: DUF4785 domain-containing protein [Telluria sp.]